MAFEGLEDVYPLSATQAGMVFHSLADTNSFLRGVWTNIVIYDYSLMVFTT